MDLENEAPNVVTEPRFRDLVASGYRVEVVCRADAFKKGPNWHGVWIMRAVSDEGVEKLLVTARTRTSHNDIKIREIRTVTGVISFLQGIGFSHADIPFKMGKRTVHKLSGEEVARLREVEDKRASDTGRHGESRRRVRRPSRVPPNAR